MGADSAERGDPAQPGAPNGTEEKSGWQLWTLGKGRVDRVGAREYNLDETGKQERPRALPKPSHLILTIIQ